MKTNKWYSIALMGLVFGACTKETIEPGDGGNVPSNTDEIGYVNLSVNLPSQSISRAESFDDGDISEWVVKDATLVLFAAGDDISEANAPFVGAYDLSLNMNIQSSTTDHITSNANIVQKINKLDGGNGDVYALVILNRNGKFSLSGNDVMFGQEAFDGTFGEFSQKLVDNQVTGNGILMANAPLYTTNGTMSNGSSQTLIKIPASSIYQTKEDAAIHSAAQVFVEKAVAKVTLNNVATGVLSDTNNPLPYTISGWMLDNTNKHAYLVRQLDNSWVGNSAGSDNRFVSSQAVAAGLYRTQWGIDPNYDTFAAPSSDNGLNTMEGTAPALKTKADTTYYCLENTFNTANQTFQSTTRAVVRAVFNGGRDFYLLNDDKTLLYEQGLSAANPLENLVAKALISEPTLNAKIKQSLNAGKTFGEGDVAGLTLSVPDATGASKVTGITLSTTDSGKYRTALTFTSDDLNRLNTQLGTLYKYVGGAAYYAVKIRHFTDDQTPAPTAGYTENEHLGRYGVLRNNWYQLTINSVKLIGAPVVPLVSGNTNPDDMDEQYISVGIKVLSWAVRTQQVDLQ